MDISNEVLTRLERIEIALDEIRQQRAVRDHYSVEEFAKIVCRAEFTVREWCRNHRLNATKKATGRGRTFEWVISHDELLRYQRDGLLPLKTA